MGELTVCLCGAGAVTSVCTMFGVFFSYSKLPLLNAYKIVSMGAT
jgi:hypothetical protein